MSCCAAPAGSPSSLLGPTRSRSRSTSRAASRRSRSGTASRSATGRRPPQLDGAVGWLRVPHVDEHPTGDHTFFVGEVERARARARTTAARLPRPELPAAVIEAVVFDLDGVLVDSEQVWDEVREQLARERGGRWHESAQRDMMGMSSPEWSRYMHERDRAARSRPRRSTARSSERMARALPRAPAARPGRASRRCERIAAALAARARVVVEPRADRRSSLELLGSPPLFKATVSSEEVARGKPAPDVYLEAARRLGVDPARCAAVEDSRERDPRGEGGRDARRSRSRTAHFPPADEEALRWPTSSLRRRSTELTPGGRRAVSRRRGRASTQPLWPPRPIAFESATSTCTSRASFGT